MRVLIATTGYAGHHLPLEPIARACARAGHEVCFAGPAARGAIARGSGFAFLPLDNPSSEEMDRVIASVSHLSPEEAHLHVIADGFVGVGTRGLLPSMLDVIEEWRPDVVVRESWEWAAALAAEYHGVPSARVALSLTSMEQAIHAAVAGPLAHMRAELGLDPDPDGDWLRLEPWLTAVPDELDTPPSGVLATPLRFREDLPAVDRLPSWWKNSNLPLVYVSFGSVAGKIAFFPGLYRDAIEAIAPLPLRVLVTTGDGDPGDLGPLPPNVHVEQWVPQEQVLPHAAAVVGHGGYGTTVGALTHGVPLVSIPLFSGDQWLNARRVAEVGAGIALAGSDDERTVFAPPGPDVMGGLRRAVICVAGAPLYRRVAGRMAGAVRALPHVDETVGALQAIVDRTPAAVHVS